MSDADKDLVSSLPVYRSWLPRGSRPRLMPAPRPRSQQLPRIHWAQTDRIRANVPTDEISKAKPLYCPRRQCLQRLSDENKGLGDRTVPEMQQPKPRSQGPDLWAGELTGLQRLRSTKGRMPIAP